MERTPIAEQIEHELLHAADIAGDWFHPHRDASQAPAATTATVGTTTTTEDHMSLLDSLKNEVASVEAKLQAVDEDALGWLNAVSANPEAKTVLSDLAGLAGVIGLPAGTISGVAAGLKTVLSLYAQQGDGVAPAPAGQ